LTRKYLFVSGKTQGVGKTYFKTVEHQELFNSLIKKARQGNDPEYSAAIYALAAIGKDISKYILPGEIKYPALFKVASVWSSGERALLKLSATLFNAGTWPVNMDDIFHHLDAGNCQVAIQAIKIRYLVSDI
jgi:hypothetical protein